MLRDKIFDQREHLCRMGILGGGQNVWGVQTEEGQFLVPTAELREKAAGASLRCGSVAAAADYQCGGCCRRQVLPYLPTEQMQLMDGA